MAVLLDAVNSNIDLSLKQLLPVKWPAIHTERIEYLTSILSHSNVQNNAYNIEAAVGWHLAFSSYENYGERFVYFQNGEKVGNWDPSVPTYWLEAS